MKKKSTSPSGFLSLRAITILFCATAACSVLTVPLLAFLRPQEQVNGSQRTLSFEERVSYQKAIEWVYWRHRIWPRDRGERPDPKPSLDAVMSETQLEKKVTDYLRNSQALEDYWQRPITAEQLQAEMDRMAKHTKQPEVLRELFEAFGNDPFVIAECLARPALAERSVTNWYGYDQRIHGELKQRAEADLQAHPSIEQMKQLSGKYTEIQFVKSSHAKDEYKHGAQQGMTLNAREWDQTVQALATMFGDAHSHSVRPVGLIRQVKTGVLSSLQDDEDRYYATAVMEKTDDRLKLASVAWRKEPFESWRARAESQVPKAMAAITSDTSSYRLPSISDGTGCIDDTWTATDGPPDGRYGHTAVWTGSEMVVWGGFTYCCNIFNSGGRYNPSTDSWTATSITNAPNGRWLHTAAWTGSEMIVWGGDDYGGNYFNTGGRYDPGTDSWTATSTTDAAAGRSAHAAVWSGSEMIIWGGYDPQGNTGGRYNPNTNSWAATSTINAPDGRANHTAVWTGSEMIVWGGFGATYFNTGGRYNPSTNSWVVTNTSNAPSGRSNHTAVWSGSEVIIWGGVGGSYNYSEIGGRYNPITDSWLPTGKTPSRRSLHTAVWTGNEMIIWGGFLQGSGGDPYTDTGGTYTPSTDSWVPTNRTNAPTGRELHTAVWSGSEMIVWGGYSYDGDDHYWNTGGRYNPGTNSWVATSITNAPVGRDSQTAVWTGNTMIVWGGYFFDGNDHYLNTGGRYNPVTDSWTATSMNNAPSARAVHTAVWTGSEMVLWGGADSVNYFNTGGRYSPATDSWLATNLTNAPSGRDLHRAVWTGNEMIIWGGYFFDGNDRYLNTGGRYNPDTNSWLPTNIVNVPDARARTTAVWSGTEMIVWGGHADFFSVPYFNTGGRYNPGTDSWVATNINNAPDGRYRHTAVWTGNEMIIWGGILYTNTYTSTGGRYCAQSGPPPTPTPTPRVTPRPHPSPRVRPTPR